MKVFYKIGVTFASLACTLMAVPQVTFAAQPAVNQQETLEIRDVSLATGGTLKGQILARNGQARTSVPVLLGRQGKTLAQTTTNAKGEFEFRGVPSGVFHVSAGSQGGMYRVWSERTAPPQAKTGVLIVNDEEVVRGQWGDYWKSLSLSQKSLILAGAATATVIGVAVAQDDDDDAS